ncbi:MAG: hypothetical protein COA70_13870 [Planctomycetota bacterium]|nr:MAG: hypothetical protein COA70_13870 [Planctomycetota bacterium]
MPNTIPFGGAVGRPPTKLHLHLNFPRIDEALRKTNQTASDVRKAAQRNLGITIRLDRLRRRGRPSVEVLYALSAILHTPMHELLMVA